MDAEAYRPRATDVWAQSPRKANWDRRPASIDKPTGSARSRRVGLCMRQSGVESEQESCVARPPGRVVRVRKIVRNREAVLGDAFDVIVCSSRRRVGRLHRICWMRPLAFSFVSRPPEFATTIVV